MSGNPIVGQVSLTIDYRFFGKAYGILLGPTAYILSK